MNTKAKITKEYDEQSIYRSSKCSLKFANTRKKEQLDLFFVEYVKVEQFFVTYLWKAKMSNPDFHIPALLPKEITQQADTWLTARAIQCCGKQASGVVRSNIDAMRKMAYKHEKLIAKGNYRQARKQKTAMERLKNNGPILKTMEAELDSRFCSIDTNKHNHFDLWLTLSSLGRDLKIILPLKSTQHFREMMRFADDNKGNIINGVRLSNRDATFNFKMLKPQAVNAGIVVGIDVGLKNVYSTSNGQQSFQDIHGYTLDKIQDKLVRRKKGSKGFKRAQSHRKNHINYTLSKMDWTGIKKIKIEKIRQMRYKSRTSRRLSHWTYTLIFGKLRSLAEKHGVLVQEDNPAFTSRRCSMCGWVGKTNRKGKRFCCGKCGYTADADTNASVNISLNLPEVTKEDKRLYYGKKGFYWNIVGHEPIVRVA